MSSAITPKSGSRRGLLLLGLVAVLGILLCARGIQSRATRYAVLHGESVEPEVVSGVVEDSSEPSAILRELWQTRKITHREAVVDYFASRVGEKPALLAALLPLIHDAALDADSNNRERALAVMQTQHDPSLADFARAQLNNTDPQLQLLGLEYVRRSDDPKLTPELIRILQNAEPMVAAKADSILRKWTTNDFGLRLKTAIPDASVDPLAPLPPEKLALLRDNLAKWQAWWETNRDHYASLPALSLKEPDIASLPLAGDFTLQDVDGHPVQLSQFRGKPVLMTFWTTWCPGCVQEIPSLVNLQKAHAGNVAIVAVCLDGRAEDEEHEHAAGHEHSENKKYDLNDIRKKVNRLMKSRDINYTVLLDPESAIGARFNGGELPTNVILDSNGIVRRRFIGTRSPAVLEAMLQDAGLKSGAN